MTYKFTASITKEKKWFVARAVELGVTTQGRTLDEAKRNLAEAVELYIQGEPGVKKLMARESPLLTTLEVKA